MRKPIYIYGLVDPRDGRVRYVGKTNNPERRLALHLIERRRSHKRNWILLLKSIGLAPVFLILRKANKANWQAAEQFQIAFFRERGQADLNMTDGGDGCLGCHPSEETIQKIRESNTGWKHTPEARQKIQAKRKQQIISHSSETRRKIGAANRRRVLSDETKKKISESLTGKRLSEEHKRKIAAGLRRHFDEPK